MKSEDFGISIKTWRHSKVLTLAESRFLGILWIDHVGADNKICAEDLAMEFADVMGEDPAEFCVRSVIEHWKREVRHMHNHLLVEHRQIPILSASGNHGGYWIAESEAEAEAFYDTFRRRGMTGLVKASRGKQAAMVDIVQQLSFEFGELDDRTSHAATPGQVRPAAGALMPIEVVDKFLGKMLDDPGKYSEGLKKIGAKYGSILLPKDRVMAMKQKATELQEMVSRL